MTRLETLRLRPVGEMLLIGDVQLPDSLRRLDLLLSGAELRDESGLCRHRERGVGAGAGVCACVCMCMCVHV